MKYISSFYYGFESLQINQWRDVDKIEYQAEQDCLFLDGEDVLEFYSQDEVMMKLRS